MTDKKEMSVNESLAKVNKILRSAGDLILPRETNIALSILADVACQQQEEIYDLRVYAKLNSRRIDRLNEFVQRDLLTDEAEHSTAQKLLQAVDELATMRVSGEAGERAQELFLIVQDKARTLIGENDTLRNSGKYESPDLPMTIEHSIELNGTTTINSPAIEVISHLIKDGSIPLGKKNKEDRQDMIRSIHESLNIDSMSQGYENQECKAEGIYSFGDEFKVTNEEITNNVDCDFFKRKYYVNGAHAGAIYYGISGWGMSDHKNEVTLRKLLSDAISSF
ncbi:MAG: hypothetical protein RR970_08455 [Hafnia sp.]